jgi:hypothetical protein
LEKIYSIAISYIAAFKTIDKFEAKATIAREDGAVRSITMACLLACYDVTLRMEVQGDNTGSHDPLLIFSKIMRGGGGAAAMKLSLSSLDGTSFDIFQQGLPLSNPSVLRARGTVLQYFLAGSAK